MKKTLAKIAYAVAKKEANQGCQWLFFQHNQPAKVKELRKF